MNTILSDFQVSMDRFVRLVLAAILLATVLIGGGSTPSVQASTQVDIQGPAGSGAFGSQVTVLPNGNIVIVDPGYDAPGPITDVGAVYLYNGATGALISALTGSTAGDQVGSGGWVISNGNYVVASPDWNNGAATDVGAVTWVSGTTGLSGAVSEVNSLVGSTAGDRVGSGGIIKLSNGTYVVASPNWDNGAAADVGAVTWVSGTTEVSGAVSKANSLVGSTGGDRVGSGGITELGNGNYVVLSGSWHNGAAADAGAVTWGNGTTGVSGTVSEANSLVGSKAGDRVGSGGITELGNGNYMVKSPWWQNGAVVRAGAVTWGNGAMGVSGAVSADNSLVGSTYWDGVGSGSVTALSNGNFVVANPDWDNGDQYDAGAVTWGNGATGVSGVISEANSLVGSTASDQIGNCGFTDSNCVTALSTGNYVVVSPYWDNGAEVDAGAVTWGNGITGVNRVVSEANSLVGVTAGDGVGSGGITQLSNSNFVVKSPAWHNGAAAYAGAVTWGNGSTGTSGVVSEANSLVGSTAGDDVGNMTALSNGNYVVESPAWDNGAAANAGAVTWGNGSTGTSGAVSAANSLIGFMADDQVGSGSVTALSNGNYVVASPAWDYNGAADVGAVTWGNGSTGTSGVVSQANSLVGSTAGDGVGNVTVLSNGNYVVASPDWDNGAQFNAGAVTWGNGASGVSGWVSAANSLVGDTALDQIGYCNVSNFNCVTALSNGNYVVASPYWDNGSIADAGAVTWGNGSTGLSGVMSEANSLVGPTAGDQAGCKFTDQYGFPYCNNGVTALSNGNYVVVSNKWHNEAVADAGAVTWGNGSTGTSGVVSAANSLVGSTNGDSVGLYGVTVLSNGNYMVASPWWCNEAGVGVGAVTWGNGSTGTSGAVSAANSLVGSTAGDAIGSEWFDWTSKVFELNNGNYVVWSPEWDNGAAVNVGAVTLGNGIACAVSFTLGPISAANSVLGGAADGGDSMIFSYDPVNRQIVVNRTEENIISLFKGSECAYHLFAPVMNK